VLTLLVAFAAAPAIAQTPAGDQQSSQTTTADDTASETRPATTTFFGDTGLWFVPTGEILPAGRFSVSGYRANWDREAGFTDFSHFAVTFGYGVKDRVELFGSWRVITRIDRDVRPIFVPGLAESAGGLVYEYPFVTRGWSDNQVGDLLLGAKFNVLSEHRQQPVAFALRGTVKLPTGDDEEGVGTGQPDFYLDAILSKELNQRVELSGFGGVVLRGDPDGVDLPSGFRWGIGAGFPTRRSLRLFTELNGEFPFDNEVVIEQGTLIGEDGSIAPSVTEFDAPLDATIGLIWQARNGFFAGAGLNWNIGLDGRSEFGSPYGDETGDALGFQARIGYHPGVRVYVPPPPVQAPVEPPPSNRPPVVKAQCNPCTIDVCKSSTVTGDASDPDGDTLTYKWTAPTGTLANPSERQTLWTAPCEPGPVPVTVTVDDGKGGTASDTVTIQVVKPAVKEFVFEDVHFDFDRYSLRPDAARVLDEAVKAMQDNKELRIEIEGHTCNIGTAEYNLALGERRAASVREYLSSRGVGGDRLRTVSYGEERPKHDNAREETRRLNRRAALVVRVQ
jgi:outer membrane protein OmpA-like peptidoglycan-associated protein